MDTVKHITDISIRIEHIEHVGSGHPIRATLLDYTGFGRTPLEAIKQLIEGMCEHADGLKELTKVWK